MMWIVGGNYANGLYAGLAYANQIQMSMAKNIERAFAYAGINRPINEHDKDALVSETSKEEVIYDIAKEAE